MSDKAGKRAERPRRRAVPPPLGTPISDSRLRTWLADYETIAQRQHAEALAELGDAEAWRDALAAVRRHTVANLDRYLAQFIDNLEQNGACVFCASDAQEACAYVVDLAARRGARRIVKAKSMVTEEIALNQALEASGVEVTETDLGEFIIQLGGERPYHITGPALHKTLPEIRALFSRLAGEELPEDIEVLAGFARERLRERFVAADMGISGANIGVASTGTVVLVTNEGNGRMVTTLPRTHVVVMGMERLVPDWRGLEAVLTLLPRAGTGERLTTYVNAISGPRRDGDADGPEELHVVIVDNGRSRLLGTKYEQALTCIRCGSCPDFCPVYRVVGGHAYGSVYSGPIGAVITPLLFGFEGNEDLPFISTLCGACQGACPARVPLADLLLELRADIAGTRGAGDPWRLGFKAFSAVAGHRRLFDAASRVGALAAPLVERLACAAALPRVLRGWTDARELPRLAARTFGREWRKREGRGVLDGSGGADGSGADSQAGASAAAGESGATGGGG